MLGWRTLSNLSALAGYWSAFLLNAEENPEQNFQGYRVERPDMEVQRLLAHEHRIAVMAIRRIKGTFSRSMDLADFLSRPDCYFVAAINERQPVGFAIAY